MKSMAGHRDPHAAVRGRVVRDAVGAVDGDAADEVLRPVDLAEVALPPALRALPVDAVQAVGRDGDALLDLARRVLVLLLVRLAVGRRGVEDPLRATVDDEEQQLAGLVDLDQRAGVGRRPGLLGGARQRRGRGARRRCRWSSDPSYFWNAITACFVVRPYWPSAHVEPEVEVEQALLDACGLAAAARADGRERGRRRRRSARRSAGRAAGRDRRRGGHGRGRGRRGRRRVGRRNGRRSGRPSSGRRSMAAGGGRRRRRSRGRQRTAAAAASPPSRAVRAAARHERRHGEDAREARVRRRRVARVTRPLTRPRPTTGPKAIGRPSAVTTGTRRVSTSRRERQLEPDRQAVLDPPAQRRHLVGVRDERRPRQQRSDRHVAVVDALAGEAQLGAVEVVVELDRAGHLGDVVVLAQRLLLALA